MTKAVRNFYSRLLFFAENADFPGRFAHEIKTKIYFAGIDGRHYSSAGVRHRILYCLYQSERGCGVGAVHDHGRTGRGAGKEVCGEQVPCINEKFQFVVVLDRYFVHILMM